MKLGVLILIALLLNSIQLLQSRLTDPEEDNTGPHVMETMISKEFEPGQMTSEFVREIGTEMSHLIPSSDYVREFIEWGTRTTFFPFATRDGMTLQGYSMIQPECSTKPLIFFGVGYTESTAKYAHILNSLYAQGYDVFSIDYRGQGFSEHTGWNDNRDLRLNHVESSEKCQDLVDFVHRVQKEDSARCVNMDRPRPVWIGNSMGGLIGYTTQRIYSDLLSRDFKATNEGKLFSKLALIVPCIMPKGISYFHRAVFLVLSYITPKWWQSTPFVHLGDMSLESHYLSHDKSFMTYWYTFRLLASRWLKSSGCSLDFTRWMTFMGADSLLKGEPEVIQNTDILVVVAEDDRFVETQMIRDFYGVISRPSITRTGKRNLVEIPGTWHEVWGEGPSVTKKLMKMIENLIGS